MNAEGLTFDDYVDDTLAVIDAVGERPVLVGHSLGGLIAQRVAALGRARALGLLASAPPAALTAQASRAPEFAPNVPRIMTGRPFIVGNDACSVLALNQVPERGPPAIHAHLTHESGKVYRSMMMGTIRVKAGKVPVPVFVAGGTEDHIISTRLLRKTAHHYGVDAHVYEGRGHWILEEPGWEQVADDVLTWLGHGRSESPSEPDGGMPGTVEAMTTKDLDFFSASAELAACTELDVPAMELLYRLEISGDDFYQALADRIGNDEAGDLLRKNGREELGHARRVQRAISIKLGTRLRAVRRGADTVRDPAARRRSGSSCSRPSSRRRWTATRATSTGPTRNRIPRWPASFA